MTSRDMTVPFTTTDARWAAPLATAGLGVLRYGLVALLLLWGSFKFAAFEAEGIRPLVEHSPLVSWMYGAFGVRGTSASSSSRSASCSPRLVPSRPTAPGAAS